MSGLTGRPVMSASETAAAVGRMVALELEEALLKETDDEEVYCVQWSILDGMDASTVQVAYAGYAHVAAITCEGHGEVGIRSVLNRERSLAHMDDGPDKDAVSTRWDYSKEDGGYPSAVHLLTTKANEAVSA